jgi:hypothetical protein
MYQPITTQANPGLSIKISHTGEGIINNPPASQCTFDFLGSTNFTLLSKKGKFK